MDTEGRHDITPEQLAAELQTLTTPDVILTMAALQGSLSCLEKLLLEAPVSTQKVMNIRRGLQSAERTLKDEYRRRGLDPDSAECRRI